MSIFVILDLTLLHVILGLFESGFMYDEMQSGSFFFLVVLGFDVGFLNIMELPFKFTLVVDDVFDVGVELFGDVLELVPPPVLEDISGLYFIPLGHDVSAGAVLGQHEIFDGEGEDDEEEEVFGLVGDENLPCVYEIAWIGGGVPTLVMIAMKDMISRMVSHQLMELALVGRMRCL